MVQMITIALFISLPQNAIKTIKMAQVKKYLKKRFCAITLLPLVQCVEVRWSE